MGISCFGVLPIKNNAVIAIEPISFLVIVGRGGRTLKHLGREEMGSSKAAAPAWAGRDSGQHGLQVQHQ